MKSLMKWSIGLMLLIVLFLIVGSILFSTKVYETIFWSPLCFILLGAFTIIMAICCFTQGFSLKKIGFQICHLGIVVILIGACIGYSAGRKTIADFPMNTEYNQFQVENGSLVNLDFNVSVIDFEVTRYDPDYYLYQKSNDSDNYKNIGQFKKQFDGRYDIKGYGRIESSELKDDTTKDGWCERYNLTNDLILVKATPQDKHYLAKLKFIDSHNKETIENLEVNHPVNHRGWKFYLSSYDREQNSYVVLTAKKDPGVVFVIYGMWAVLIGTILLCFRKRNYLKEGEQK